MNRYWDSCCILGWLKDEPDKVPYCEGVIQQAKAGKLKIVISALTLAEVIRVKGKPPLSKEDEQKINDFFDNGFIILHDVDETVAKEARQLMWSYPQLWPKDSIHVATAIRTGVDVLDTFDEVLLKLDGQIGNPGLRITKPDLPFEPILESEGATILDQTE